MLAAPSAEQRDKLRRADAAVTRATTLYKAKKYKEAGDAVTEIGKTLAELASDKEVAKAVEPILARLKSLHGDLALQGITLPDLPTIDTTAAPTPAVGKTPVGKTPAGGAGGASFVKDVAPLLVSKCGKCHIDQTKGTLNMGTYEALMKGNKDGVVVLAGKGSGSRLVEVIDSGDMPRGGAKVTPAELASLTKWIDNGAKFDGPDDKVQLAKFVPKSATPKPEMMEPKLPVMRATGGETISFCATSRRCWPTIASVVMARCSLALGWMSITSPVCCAAARTVWYFHRASPPRACS